jgi:uncharacterized RDD family membrane protein YckC
MIHKHLLARIGQRFGAAVVDNVILIVLFYTLIFSYEVLKSFYTGISADLAIYDHYWVVYTAISFMYTTVLMAGKYQATIGQRLFGIKVQMVDGHSVHFSVAAIRWLFSLLSTFVLWGGYLVALLVNDRRTFHDYHSGTVVVVDSYLDSRRYLTLNDPDDREQTIRDWPSVKEQWNTRSLSENSSAYSAAQTLHDDFEDHASVNKSGAKRLGELSIADVFWEKALEEYEGQGRKKGLWARCYVESNGDQNKAMAAYLQNRAEHFASVSERQKIVSRRNKAEPTSPNTRTSPVAALHHDKYEKLVEKFNRGSRSAAVVEAKLEAVTGKRVTRTLVDEQILFSFAFKANRYCLTKDQAVVFISKRE